MLFDNSHHVSELSSSEQIINYLQGPFGSGKTLLIEKYIDSNPNSIVLASNNFNGSSIFDLYMYLASQLEKKEDDSLNFVDTFFYGNRFIEIKEQLEQSSINFDEYLINKNLDFLSNQKDPNPDLDENYFKKGHILALESFVIDLIKYFDQENDKENRVKIILIFDNIDDIIFDIQSRVINLFKEYLDKKINKYEFFENDLEYTLSDYFDIKIICSSRLDLAKSDKTLKLSYPDKVQIEETLEKTTIATQKLAEKAHKIPFVLDLLINKGEDNLEQIYSRSLSELFRFSTESETYLLSSLAYVDEFDFRYLDLYNDKIEPTYFDYLDRFKGLLEHKDDQFALIDSIKHFIEDALRHLDSKSHNYFNENAILYKSLKSIIDSNSKDGFEYLLKLSICKNFNTNVVLDTLFEKEDVQKVRKFIESSNMLFTKTKHTYSLDSDLQKLLNDYYEKTNNDSLETTRAKLKNLWNEYRSDLNRKIESYEKENDQIRKEIRKYEISKSKYEKDIEEINRNILEIESKAKFNNDNYKKYENKQKPIRTLITSLIILVGIIFTIFAFIKDLHILFQYGSGVITFVLLVLTLPHIFRLIKRNRKKDLVQSLVSKKENLDQEIEILSDNSKRVSADLKANLSKLDELEADLKSYSEIIEEIRSELREDIIEI